MMNEAEATKESEMTDAKTVDVFGDILEVEYNGSVWTSPYNGQQHSTGREAMEAELRAYYRASGDDPDDLDVSTTITEHLDGM